MVSKKLTNNKQKWEPAAACKSDVSESCIRDWRKKIFLKTGFKSLLLQFNASKRANMAYTPWSENKVYPNRGETLEYISENSQLGYAVSIEIRK